MEVGYKEKIRSGVAGFIIRKGTVEFEFFRERMQNMKFLDLIEHLLNLFFESKDEVTYDENGFIKETPQKKPSTSRQSLTFDEKLKGIVEKLGYNLLQDISIADFENKAGQEIYTRRKGCCDPRNISYAICEGGKEILYIRYWEKYNNEYSRVANREVKAYCDSNGIKMLDFFDRLPNEEDYMSTRIQNTLSGL